MDVEVVVHVDEVNDERVVEVVVGVCGVIEDEGVVVVVDAVQQKDNVVAEQRGGGGVVVVLAAFSVLGR